MSMLDPVASRLPWMVAAGNHEIEAGSTGGKPFVAYEHRFRMPAVGPPVSSYQCGRGGGLDGKGGGSCWAGLGEDEAQAAATQESMRLEAKAAGLVGFPAMVGGATGDRGEKAELAVAAAARQVRVAFDPEAVVAYSGDGGYGAGEDVDRLSDEQREVSCCPSEWSGTYDYGNRYVVYRVFFFVFHELWMRGTHWCEDVLWEG